MYSVCSSSNRGQLSLLQAVSYVALEIFGVKRGSLMCSPHRKVH